MRMRSPTTMLNMRWARGCLRWYGWQRTMTLSMLPRKPIVRIVHMTVAYAMYWASCQLLDSWLVRFEELLRSALNVVQFIPLVVITVEDIPQLWTISASPFTIRRNAENYWGEYDSWAKGLFKTFLSLKDIDHIHDTYCMHICIQSKAHLSPLTFDLSNSRARD